MHMAGTEVEATRKTSTSCPVTMCGRSACTLAPDDVVRACRFRNRQGQYQRPVWRDAPGGKKFYPSPNIAPTLHTPVLLSSKHYPGELDGISERVVQPMKWGLTPSWHKGDPYKMEYETNNCRAEGMLTKRTYKVPLEKGQRCVVLAEGFFEWKRTKDAKQPYFIYAPHSSEGVKTEVKTEEDVKPELKPDPDDIKPELKPDPADVKPELKTADIKPDPDQLRPIKTEPEDAGYVKPEPDATSSSEQAPVSSTAQQLKSHLTGDLGDLEVGGKAAGVDGEDGEEWHGKPLLKMAGVFDVWYPPDGSDPIYSYSVITVDASPAMSWIHHRMPAILTSDQEVRDWLEFSEVPLNKAVKYIRPTEMIQMHMVSPIVNNSRNKSPECMEPYTPKEPKRSASSSLMMNWLVKGRKPTEQESPDAKKQKPN